MKITFNTIIEKAKTVKLTDTEKRAQKQKLLAYIKEHQPVLSSAVIHDELRRHQGYGSISVILSAFTTKKLMPVALMIALLLTAGTTYAARGAVPGDALYPVKTYVNENIQLATAFGTEAEAKVKTEHALARLDEVRELEARGELNPETRAELEARFEEDSTVADRLIAKLEEKGKYDAAAEVEGRYEAKLLAHVPVVAVAMRSADSFNAATLAAPANNQPDAQVVAMSLKATASPEARSNTEVAAENVYAAAANKINEVEAFLEMRKDEVSAEAVAEARVKLGEARQFLIEGNAKLEAKIYDEAFVLFKKAQYRAQEAKVRVGGVFERAQDRVLYQNSNASVNSNVTTDTEVQGPEVKASTTNENRVDINRGNSGSLENNGRINLDLGL